MRQTTGGRRPRGRPNRKQHLSSRNQTFDSNGPEVRVRGNAHQVYEKYLALARDATASGDRIAAEGFYQFAEHYFRILSDSTDPDRQRPDGPGAPGNRRDGRFQQVDGRPPRGGEAAGQPEGRAADGNGADRGAERSDGEAQEGADEPQASPEPEKQAKPAGSGRRRAPRRAKRENANGEDTGGDETSGDEASEKLDAKPATP